MKIETIKYSNNYHTNFKGNRLTRFVVAMSPRYSSEKLSVKEFKYLNNVYNNLWKKLSLPEKLKPELKSKRMLSMMGFSVEDYAIYVDTSLSPFKMKVRNKTGQNEETLRHEIEHVKQIWQMIRLLGVNKFINEIRSEQTSINCKIKHYTIKKLNEIEQTLGRISPDSQEGKTAQLYVDALRKYPNTEEIIDPIVSIIRHIKYKNNLLEINANKAAKDYKPSLLKKIKIAFNEFIKLLVN